MSKTRIETDDELNFTAEEVVAELIETGHVAVEIVDGDARYRWTDQGRRDGAWLAMVALPGEDR